MNNNVALGDDALQAHRKKEMARKNRTRAKRDSSLKMIRLYLKNLVGVFRKLVGLVSMYGGRRPSRIRRREKEVRELLKSLRTELAKINFPFSEIDPGKTPSRLYFPNIHVWIQTWQDRSNYWDQILKDPSKPWA